MYFPVEEEVGIEVDIDVEFDVDIEGLRALEGNDDIVGVIGWDWDRKWGLDFDCEWGPVGRDVLLGG